MWFQVNSRRGHLTPGMPFIPLGNTYAHTRTYTHATHAASSPRAYRQADPDSSFHEMIDRSGREPRATLQRLCHEELFSGRRCLDANHPFALDISAIRRAIVTFRRIISPAGIHIDRLRSLVPDNGRKSDHRNYREFPASNFTDESRCNKAGSASLFSIYQPGRNRNAQVSLCKSDSAENSFSTGLGY